jgi:chromosome segregation ATPase
LAEENETKIDSNTPTAEDYEALKAELEAEKQKAQTAVAEATQALTEKVITLEADLAAKTGELETIQGQLAEATTARSELKTAHSELVEELEGAKAAYAYAVEDFKKLVLQTNPLFTPDIIEGDTIDAVKASVEKASVLVSKVKEGLEAQASALSQLSVVPAGAPVRGQISTEGLSAKEKINLGLEQARKKKE